MWVAQCVDRHGQKNGTLGSTDRTTTTTSATTPTVATLMRAKVVTGKPIPPLVVDIASVVSVVTIIFVVVIPSTGVAIFTSVTASHSIVAERILAVATGICAMVKGVRLVL
jgi:hypothetical protein